MCLNKRRMLKNAFYKKGGIAMRNLPAGKAQQRLAIAGLLLVAAIWGAGFVFTKYTLEAGLSPSAVMLGRFGLAAIACLVFFNKTLRREYKKGQWKGGLTIGVVLFAAFYTQTAGLQYTTPSNSAFITGAYVVMVPFLWWMLAKKRPAWVLFLACFVALAGVGVLSIQPGGGFALGFGDALTLVCAGLYAVQIVATALLARTMHPTVLVTWQFSVAAVLSLAAFLITDRNIAAFAQSSGWAAIAYLGLCSTFMGFGMQTLAQTRLSSAKTGIVLSTEALFGALFSVVFGFESVNTRMVVGGVLLFVSILLPEIWAARRASRGEG